MAATDPDPIACARGQLAFLDEVDPNRAEAGSIPTSELRLLIAAYDRDQHASSRDDKWSDTVWSAAVAFGADRDCPGCQKVVRKLGTGEDYTCLSHPPAAIAVRSVIRQAVSLAAKLVHLPDRVPKRGDPAHDHRPELVDRESVVQIAMKVKELGRSPR